MDINSPFVISPAPALDARRPAGLTYALQLGNSRLVNGRAPGTIRTFRSLRRAIKAADNCLYYEPVKMSGVRAVVITSA